LVKGSTLENDMQKHFLSSQTQEVLGGLFGQTDFEIQICQNFKHEQKLIFDP